MSLQTDQEQFSELVAQAKQGNPIPLNAFFVQLYRKGKQSLRSLTASEDEAEEYFSSAVAKFWEKFVLTSAPLPETNIGGYIYTMAKFLFLDHKRSGTKLNVVDSVEATSDRRKQLGEVQKVEAEYREEEKSEEVRREAMQRGIAKLGANCRQLFSLMMEKGLEKPRELYTVLGLKNARAVTVLRYECTKQLKVKAAIELDLLIGHERG